MAFIKPWRDFKRMQDVAVGASVLIYAGGVTHAFQVLDQTELLVQRALVWPSMVFLLAFLVPLVVRPVSRVLARYVWMSFHAGFGQTPVSVLTGIGLLCGAALLIYWQVAEAARGGPYPAAVFSGYAAGIGIIAAQALLVRVLERDPQVRPVIEEKAP